MNQIELTPNIPRMGYILCVKAPKKKDIFARGIISQQLKRGLSEEASQYVHVEVLGGGYNSVRVAPPTTQIIDDFTKFYKGRYIKILKVANNQDYEDRLRYKIAFWAASHCNLKYDWFGIAHFIFGKLITGSKVKMFCSENTLWAIHKELPLISLDVKNNKPEECMPAHFIQSQLDNKELSLVWEGLL